MEYDLFTKLYKYKETENKNNLENYITEAFCYILKYLIKSKNSIVIELMNLFDIPIANLENTEIEIDTQNRFSIEQYNRYARPDIKICINGQQIYFIECKVDQDLNQYEDIGDQIQLYEAIKVPNKENCGVRLLSKYTISTEGKQYSNFLDKHKIYWRQVYEILKKLDDNILVKIFLYFMEENDMGEINKLVYSKESHEYLGSFISVYDFLKRCVDELVKKIHSKCKSDFEMCDDYFGFYVNYNEAKAWFGLYSSREDPHIYCELLDIEEPHINPLIKLLKLEAKRFTDDAYSRLSIAKITEKKNFDAQKAVFDSWIEKEFILEIMRTWILIQEMNDLEKEFVESFKGAEFKYKKIHDGYPCFFWELSKKNLEVFYCLKGNKPEIGFASHEGTSFSNEQVKKLKAFLQNTAEDLKNITKPYKPPIKEGNEWVYYKIKNTETKLSDVIRNIKFLLEYENV